MATIRLEQADFEQDIWEDEILPDIDEYKQAFVDAVIPLTPIDTGYARSQWRIGYDDDVIAENDAEYISYLEEGHSSQAPDGFMEDAHNIAYAQIGR